MPGRPAACNSLLAGTVSRMVTSYAEVRRCVYVEGVSERAAARRIGLARETVRKRLRYRL